MLIINMVLVYTRQKSNRLSKDHSPKPGSTLVSVGIILFFSNFALYLWNTPVLVRSLYVMTGIVLMCYGFFKMKRYYKSELTVAFIMLFIGCGLLLLQGISNILLDTEHTKINEGDYSSTDTAIIYQQSSYLLYLAGIVTMAIGSILLIRSKKIAKEASKGFIFICLSFISLLLLKLIFTTWGSKALMGEDYFTSNLLEPVYALLNIAALFCAVYGWKKVQNTTWDLTN